MKEQSSTTRIAAVTGSAKKRLGYNIACEAARRGYAVALHFNTSSEDAKLTAKELLEIGAPRVELYQADFSVPDEVENIAFKLLSDFGRIDLLVNTASIWPKRSLQETDYAELKRNLDVNLGSVFILSKLLGLQMTNQPDGGSIINFGDWSIHRPYLGYSAYYASKGAIPTITATFAKELAALNPKVRVNCIAPGPVMVPEEISEEEKAQIVRATVVKRLGSPDDVVQAVFSLVDNTFMTGSCLTLDGGRSIV